MSQYISFDVPIPPIPVADTGDFCCTFDRKFLPYVIGALQALLDNSTYESNQVDSVQQSHTLIGQIQSGVCQVSMPIGAIIMYATGDVPENCLECDGAQYQRVDYPDLYAALDATYIVDADNFTVPDFRSRAPIGKGQGAGLTARTMNSAVGAETHTLTEAQMPAHTHDITAYGGNHNTSTGSNIDLSANNSNQTTKTTSSKGSGNAHNNMQPSRVTGFCIVATTGA